MRLHLFSDGRADVDRAILLRPRDPAIGSRMGRSNGECLLEANDEAAFLVAPEPEDKR